MLIAVSAPPAVVGEQSCELLSWLLLEMFTDEALIEPSSGDGEVSTAGGNTGDGDLPLIGAGCVPRSKHASSKRRALRRVRAMMVRAREAMTVAAAV